MSWGYLIENGGVSITPRIIGGAQTPWETSTTKSPIEVPLTAFRVTESGSLFITGSLGATLTVSDIQIGAVEIKNATTDDRVIVDGSGFLYVSSSIDPVISSSLVSLDGKDFALEITQRIATGSLAYISASVSSEATLVTVSASLASISASNSAIFDELKPSTDIDYAATFYKSTAFESGSIVKDSAGVLYGFTGYNSGSAQFILVHDVSNMPADGVIPIIPIRVPATSNFSWDSGRYGIPMANGIVFANSSTPDALTSASADCWFNVTYK